MVNPLSGLVNPPLVGSEGEQEVQGVGLDSGVWGLMPPHRVDTPRHTPSLVRHHTDLCGKNFRSAFWR